MGYGIVWRDLLMLDDVSWVKRCGRLTECIEGVVVVTGQVVVVCVVVVVQRWRLAVRLCQGGTG